MKKVNFIDKADIFCKAGSGGQGSSAIRRIKTKVINSGGNGGKGGNIYIRANPNVFDLSDYRRKKFFTAVSGKDGLAGKKTGRDGEDLVLDVPLGTRLKGVKGQVIKDLILPYEPFLLVNGGAGGKGNFKKKTVLPPERGQEKNFLLDLILPVDVAILGFTNSGKSTLLSRITNLNPEISEFPFNTKFPLVGVTVKEYARFTIAEIPAVLGLSKHNPPGVGFLKHIQRAKILLFLLDPGIGSLSLQYERLKAVISKNTRAYKGKYNLIVVNKIDKIKGKIASNYIGIQADRNLGIDKLIDRIILLLKNEKEDSCKDRI
jgi:GTPase